MPKWMIAIFAAVTAAVVLTLSFTSPRQSTVTSFEPPRPPKKTLAEKQRFAKERLHHEWMLLRDPATGEIPKGIFNEHKKMWDKAPVAPRRTKQASFQSRGPGNVGGRTRAIAFDMSDPTGNTMLAGGVTSGMMRTTNGGAGWTKVTGASDIHSVTSIAQDPTSPEIWYYGTGELLGFRGLWGDGIWRSTDGGLNWTQLAETASTEPNFIDNSFDVVHRLAVDPATGHVYAAIHRNIMRSTDQGLTWEPTLGTTESAGLLDSITDIVINADGTAFYAAFGGGSPENREGVWFSPTGEPDSWTKIAGNGAAADPADWRAPGQYGRVVLGLSPNGSLYALYVNGHVNNCEQGTQERSEADLFRYDPDPGEWTNLTANMPDEPNVCLSGNDPFAVQGGYNLVVAVSPINPNVVFVGGTNLYRSIDGFTTNTRTSRIGGYASSSNYNLYENHHPDIHSLIFDPNNPNVLITGTDGGIHSGLITDTFPRWNSFNNDYVTLQYYAVAQSQEAGDERIIGGTQDNGTLISFTGTDHQIIAGGDGVSVAVGPTTEVGFQEADIYFLGFQFGNIFRLNTVSGFQDIKPAGSGEGLFVTLFYLDPDNTDFLYYADDNTLYRTGNALQVNTNTWTEMTGIAQAVNALPNNLPPQISALAASRGPYTAESKLIVGDNLGRVFVLGDPQGAAPTAAPVEITPPEIAVLVQRPLVSGIALDPLDDDVIMVSYSNFGVPGLFLTLDGGQSWQDIEGNLAGGPAKLSAAIAGSGDERRYFAGTTVGLWSTDLINGAETVWEREGVDTVRSSMIYTLTYRPSDGRLLAGTYGNGVFTGEIETVVTTGKSYYLPEILSGNGNDTVIGIVNSGDDQIEIDLLGFTTDGELIGISTFLEQLAPRASARFSISEAFPEDADRIRWVRITPGGEIAAYAELIGDGTRSAYNAVPAGSEVLMPHIAKNTLLFETVLSAVNTSSNQQDFAFTELPGGLEFTLEDAGGPFSQSSRPVTDLLGFDLLEGPDLWARVDANEPVIAAMEYFTRIPDRTQQAALGLDAQSGRTLNFLHVATDTNQFWTGMLYINLGLADANITETFYDADGNVILQDQEVLGPNGKITLLFDFENQVEVPAGTAWLQVTADQDLIGYELFGTPRISGNDTFTGLQGNYGGGNVLTYPYFTNDPNEFTGIVALNLGDLVSDITFTAYDVSNQVLETVTIEGVAPKTKMVRVVEQIFTEPNTLANSAWVRAVGSDSEWAGFLLWGDRVGDRQNLSGINAWVK
jgi:hypothetical protein